MFEQQRIQQQHAAYNQQSRQQQQQQRPVQHAPQSISPQPAQNQGPATQQQPQGQTVVPQAQQQPPKPYPIPTDYVYFERSPHGFRKDTLEKAQAAKLKLEHFYQKAVQEAIERNGRSVCYPAQNWQ